MDELVDIIRKLFKDTGIGVLSDKRTCNIVNDLSPIFRNNRNYQKILDIIVDNRLMDSIINSSYDNRLIEIARIGKKIREGYWLDMSDTTRILCALSLGAELINKEDCDKFLYGDFNVVNNQVVQTKNSLPHIKKKNGSSVKLDPREPFTKYKFPNCNLLKHYGNDSLLNQQNTNAEEHRVEEALNSFGIHISKIKATNSPLMILFEVTPTDGTTIRQFRLHESDIAINLGVPNLHVVAPMPGRGTVGIEILNEKPQLVPISSVLNSTIFQNSQMILPIGLGISVLNDVVMADLTVLHHLLISGAEGQGKSTCLNTIITTLLYKKHPNELKFVLIDSHNLEFAPYNKIASHYMAALPEYEEEPIINDAQRAVETLNSLCSLMQKRLNLLGTANVKNIVEYNNAFVSHKLLTTNGHEFMPYIVVIIDDFGDFVETAGDEFRLPLVRLARLAYIVGIHLVISTKKMTRNVITNDILSNFQARITFRLTSPSESKMVIGETGAEKLLGHGDMFFHNLGKPQRIEGAYIDISEIEAVCHFISTQPGPIEPLELPSEYNNDSHSTETVSWDPFFEEAAHAIVSSQQGSTSMIQRRFSIGYNRAGHIIDQLENAGIVGPSRGAKPREVLVDNEYELNSILEQVHNGVPAGKIAPQKTSAIHNNSSLYNGSTSIPPTPTKIEYKKDSSWKGCSGCLVSIIVILLSVWVFGFFDSKDKNQGNIVAKTSMVYKDISFMDITLGGDYGAVLKGMKVNPNINDVKVVNLKGEEYNVALYTKSNTMFLDLDSIKEGLPLDTVITASAKLDGSIVGIFASVFNNKVIKINILTPNSNMVFLKSLLTDKYGVASDSVNQASKGEGEFSYYWRFKNGSVYLNYSEYSEDECMIVIKSSEIPKYNQILEEQEKVKKDSAHNMASKII